MNGQKHLAYLGIFLVVLVDCVHSTEPSDQISCSMHTPVAAQATQSSVGDLASW